MSGAGPPAAQMPRILIYALGNYTHPGTRHSLGQFVLGGLAKELGLPVIKGLRGGPTNISIGYGRLEEKKVNGWTGWLGAGGVDLVEVKKDIFGRAVARQSRTEGSGTDSGSSDMAHMTMATPREPMNLSGRNLSNLVRTLSTVSTPPDAKSPKQLLSPPTVLFLHDSLEIPSSTYKGPSLKATTEGHNGLRSCSACPHIYPPSTVNPNSSRGGKFWRLSLGIGRPGDGTRFSAGNTVRSKSGEGADIAKWVMGKLHGEERLFWEGEGVRAIAKEVKRWAREL